MKRIAPLCLLAALACFIVTPLLAATSASEPPAATSASPALGIANALTTVTGIAISPLLGTGAYGVYKYYSADSAQRESLPWFAKPTFFLPALLVVLLCACKDSLGAILPPGLKKPLDVLETVENKASGLVAAGAVVPFTMDSLSQMITGSGTSAAGTVDGVHTAGLAMLHFGAIDLSWALNLLTIPIGIAVFLIVWLASHAINVLILLSPWGAIDAALKAARTSLLGLIAVTGSLNPKLAVILSLAVIIIAYFVAGWSFRLMIFGSDFCWDFFTLRRHRFKLAPNANKLFSGARLKGVPARTYGRLVNEPENGTLAFNYRPWLVLPVRRLEVKLTAPYVGKGLFFSSLCDGDTALFLLPPRYHGHEEKFAEIYKLEGGVRPAGLLKAWSVLRELFSGSATKSQVV